jgi:hypothetical protein
MAFAMPRRCLPSRFLRFRLLRLITARLRPADYAISIADIFAITIELISTARMIRHCRHYAAIVAALPHASSCFRFSPLSDIYVQRSACYFF